jgi:hypothetical protein
MKINVLSVFFLLLIIGSTVNAQQFPPQYPNRNESSDRNFINAVYLEMGGASGFASLNYDLTINQDYVFRLGISLDLFLAMSDSDNDPTFEPVEDFSAVLALSKLYGSDQHKIETGAGVVFGGSNLTKYDYPKPPGMMVNIGYRFYTLKSRGLSTRLAFTPILNEEGFNPWIGFSIGISFKPN